MASREYRRLPDEAEYSSLRWAVVIEAEVHEQGSCPLPVQIVDISTTGCRLWAGFRLTAGRSARLRIGGLAPLRVQIVWSRDWYAALRFDSAVHSSVLRHLVTAHQPSAAGVRADRVASITAPSIP